MASEHEGTAARAAAVLRHPAILIVLAGSLAAITPASNTLYVASMPAMVADLASDPAAVQLTLSGFLLAFAVGQLVWGPLSDRYGRRACLLAGLTVYALASLGCAVAPGIEALILLRLMQAFGACSAPVIVRAVVRDLYDREGTARVMSYVNAVFAATPVLAPTIGALIEQGGGWRWSFAFMTVLGGLLFFAVSALLPETHPETRRSAIAPRSVARNYATVVTDRVFLGYALGATFGYAAFFIFVSVSPYIFIGLIGLSPERYAILFGVVAAGFGLGSYLSAGLTRRLGLDRVILLGVLVGLLAAGALNVFAIGRAPSVYAILLPMVIVSLGIGLVFSNCQAGAVSAFPRIAGAASAMAGLLQTALGALMGIVVLQFYDGTQHAMTLGVLAAFAAVALFYIALAWRRRDARSAPAR